MPKVKTTIPVQPSREKGQRSLDPMFLNRYAPAWSRPYWQNAAFWRSVVLNLPVAIDCREFIIGYVASLEWKIEPKDSAQREELKDEILYYTDLFESGGYAEDSGWDYLKMIEWGLQDALDLPFGSAFETIRSPDNADGKVVKIIPIDGGTLFPTRDKKWPIVQRLQDYPTRPVVFPAHAINRYYYSPRNEIQMEGWGMSPPEKIFLAINMLSNGDNYYWKFMTDTPEAGILDLMDMDQESAVDWVSSFRELWTGLDPFKIPVLYEHEQAAKFISFGKDPNSIDYANTYHRYVILTCAGYGISPSDIGFPSVGGGGGQTLAGSIRDERRTGRSMIARTKKMLQYWFNRMLPKTLKFTWIDLDDEVSVALGRARLANATAMGQLIKDKVFTQKEARLQILADGLWSTPVPEDIPEDEFIDLTPAGATERPGMLGSPINPSQGGKGEIAQRSYFDTVVKSEVDLSDDEIKKLALTIAPAMIEELSTTLEKLDDSEIVNWVRWHNEVLWGNLTEKIPELTLSIISCSETEVKKIANDRIPVKAQEITKSVNSLVDLLTDEYDIDDTKQLKSEVRRKMRNVLSELNISRSIVAGYRNWILKAELLEDASAVNVFEEVRFEVDKYAQNVLDRFYSDIEELVKSD